MQFTTSVTWREKSECAELITIDAINYDAQMPRVTLTLESRDHLALKLLAISQHKKMIQVLEDAVRSHLEQSGAYRLAISSVGESGPGE